MTASGLSGVTAGVSRAPLSRDPRSALSTLVSRVTSAPVTKPTVPHSKCPDPGWIRTINHFATRPNRKSRKVRQFTQVTLNFGALLNNAP